MIKQIDKSLKKLVVALAVGCVSFSVMASNTSDSEETNLSISPSKKNATVTIRAWNLSANTPATIKVVNKFGNTVYEEKVEGKNELAKRYDFSKMKPGKYTLVLESSANTVSKPFVVGSSGMVREDKSEAYQYFRPRVIEKRTDRSVHIAFHNITDVPLNLLIMDKLGKVVYSAKVPGYQDFNKMIDLTRLPKNRYLVRFYNSDYLYDTEVRNY